MLHTDLHVHTRYCHGLGEPMDIVQRALSMGATGIGLLGHAKCETYTKSGMSPERRDALFALTTQAKNAYLGKINVFRGIELDYYALPLNLPYDYRIGSVHMLKHGEDYIIVDGDKKALDAAIIQYYDSDPRELVKDYYRILSDVVNKTGADIVGHFDLVSKYNEFTPFYDEEDLVVRDAALNAMETLVKQNPLFEINTGAISRGCRTTPYPAKWLLEALYEMGGRIIFSSDAHQPEHIFYLFEESVALAKACGYKTAWRLMTEGFCEYPL